MRAAARVSVLSIALTLAPTVGAERAKGPGAGDPAPDLQLRTLEGDPYDLEDLRGRVVVAKFGFTW